MFFPGQRVKIRQGMSIPQTSDYRHSIEIAGLIYCRSEFVVGTMMVNINGTNRYEVEIEGRTSSFTYKEEWLEAVQTGNHFTIEEA